jgi:hypothetical protein
MLYIAYKRDSNGLRTSRVVSVEIIIEFSSNNA